MWGITSPAFTAILFHQLHPRALKMQRHGRCVGSEATPQLELSPGFAAGVAEFICSLCCCGCNLSHRGTARLAFGPSSRSEDALFKARIPPALGCTTPSSVFRPVPCRVSAAPRQPSRNATRLLGRSVRVVALFRCGIRRGPHAHAKAARETHSRTPTTIAFIVVHGGRCPA